MMKYFKPNEFKMGNKVVCDRMNEYLLYQLDILRGRLGVPLTITSSYRTEAYNKKVGGSSRSQHLLGNAVDIKNNFSGQKLRELIQYCLNNDLSFGISKDFVHIDCRETLTCWGY